MIRSTIQELLNSNNPCEIIVLTDNRSLQDAIYSTKTVEDKRLKVDICTLRDMVNRKEITEVIWIESEKQLADSLTKGGASTARLLQALAGWTDII